MENIAEFTPNYWQVHVHVYITISLGLGLYIPKTTHLKDWNLKQKLEHFHWTGCWTSPEQLTLYDLLNTKVQLLGSSCCLDWAKLFIRVSLLFQRNLLFLTVSRYCWDSFAQAILTIQQYISSGRMQSIRCNRVFSLIINVQESTKCGQTNGYIDNLF